jgi:hypothetical protein
MKSGLFLLILLFGSCNYHIVRKNEEVAISLPFITGDKDGTFTKWLSSEISSSGITKCSSRDTRYQLQVRLNPEIAERIGFRYDRKPDGALLPNIIGTETRQTMVAIIELIDTYEEKVIYGPKEFRAHADFDYLDSDNIADMSFINPQGERTLSFNYSLGQLNTIEGSTDAAMPSIYRILSKKIADELAWYFNIH